MTVNSKKSKPVYAGLSVTRHGMELAIFSPKSLSIEQSASIPAPPGLFDIDADMVRDAGLLKEMLAQLLRGVNPKPSKIHLSLPGTLLRLVEMPKMDPSGLYVSLSSEAERYKMFDHTEAIVDFSIVNNPNIPANHQQLVFGAVRSDTLSMYLKVLKELNVKAASISLEPLNVLRALAGTGVLDGLVQQIGADAHWGMIFVEPTRVRLSLWQCDRLLELRETAMETQDFAHATPDSIVVEDMLEEIRRTSKNVQPTLWLTHDLPPSMQQILSQRLNCPLHTAPLGEGLIMNQPLQPATVGTALSSSVAFPFEFDLAAGIGKSGTSSTSASASMPSAMEESGGGGAGLIPLGATLLVLGGLASAGLFVMSMLAGQQLPQLQSKRDGIQMEVGSLSAREADLKKKVELDNSLLEMVKKSKIRNHVYVALTDDLRRKTPEKIWIRSLTADDDLTLNGKALSHQSVINFARSFDAAPYTQAIVINAIKEGKLGGSLVYDFVIGGGVNLDPSLLPPESDTEAKAEKLEEPGSP